MQTSINHNSATGWMGEEFSRFLNFRPLLKKKLYSRVSELISAHGCRRVIDYGCGEGNQVSFLDRSLNIDLYDINKAFSSSAYNKYKKTYQNLGHVGSVAAFDERVYDAVIVNMVWMCLRDDSEIESLLDNVCRIKKKYGIVLLSMTNPYSRNIGFSYYETDYSRGGKLFRYHRNGEAFNVYIKDESRTIFTDYHWTLEFTYKKLRGKNLVLDNYIELEDIPLSGYHNSKMPPYIMLVLKENR